MIFLMKYSVCFFFLSIMAIGHCQLPKGFVYLSDVAPSIRVDLRYYTANNFVGEPITGYHNECVILTQATALALKRIEAALNTENLGLKIYDSYRPQQAVNHFVRWARVLNDTLKKSTFYPDVKKNALFKEGYIASHSGHTKGSTVDLTLVNLETNEELDMGSIFDFFGEQSWVAYKGITKAQQKNRAKLQQVMLAHGFRNYAKEWWHFTLRQEPFPKTYFDFPIE